MSNRPPRQLKGTSSKAPCWWCSRQLHGWKGWEILIDGKPTMVHADCAREISQDADFHHRLALPEGSKLRLSSEYEVAGNGIDTWRWR